MGYWRLPRSVPATYILQKIPTSDDKGIYWMGLYDNSQAHTCLAVSVSQNTTKIQYRTTVTDGESVKGLTQEHLVMKFKGKLRESV